MTAVAAAALSLAAALLMAPNTPRRRLSAAPASLRVPRLVKGAALTAPTLLGWALAGPFVALAATVLGATLVARRRRRAARQRGLRERAAMAQALEMLTAELRVGNHPIRGFAAGLRSAAAYSGQPADWDRLAVFWQLATDHGLAVAALMRAAQRDIVERQRFHARVDAGMAGARATTAILAALPAVGILLGQAMGARPLAFLAGDGFGGVVLMVGVALVCVGLVWADRITGRATA